MKNITWKRIREHPLYPSIKNRSKKDKETLLRELGALHKKLMKEGDHKNLILPDEALQSQLLLSFLNTAQKGLYGTLSTGTKQITKTPLWTEKVDRVLLSLDNWLGSIIGSSEKRIWFTDGNVHFQWFLDRQPKIRIFYGLTSTNMNKQIILDKNDVNVLRVLKTTGLVYDRFHGRFHYSSNTLFVKRGKLSHQDYIRINEIHEAKPIELDKQTMNFLQKI